MVADMSDGYVSQIDLEKIYRNLISPEHKRFFVIARYTGEKFNRITKLKIGDVYDENCYPLDVITFGRGTSDQRDAIVFERLKELLSYHRPKKCDLDAWLFPSKSRTGNHIGFAATDKWLRNAAYRADIDHWNISTHTFRKVFVTTLYEHGMSIEAIQETVGFKTQNSVTRYIADKTQKIAKSLNNIFP